ncbi:hypothetical protein BurJ1DRAFT_0018 [Burkholderiales bacterium JOSHI_001]|nr:hypothetical protein BurJ1DRAFT_0018 [Burkholderiales bacterium JOSHI_001]
MSPRWTTRLDARLGPRGLQLELASRLPWDQRAPLWQRAWPGPIARDQAADALASALADVLVEFRRTDRRLPATLGIELDDAWVLHALLRGAFDRMGSGAAADAAARFFQQALGSAPADLRLALSPQPDGRSLWASALPEALCGQLGEVARVAGLRLRSLRPAAQHSVAGRTAWPAHGVLALPHAHGLLLALRRGGSWVALANERMALTDAVTRRADALLRFHGVPAANGSADGPREQQRWARVDLQTALPEGWSRVQGRGAAGAPAATARKAR